VHSNVFFKSILDQSSLDWYGQVRKTGPSIAAGSAMRQRCRVEPAYTLEEAEEYMLRRSRRSHLKELHHARRVVVVNTFADREDEDDDEAVPSRGSKPHRARDATAADLEAFEPAGERQSVAIGSEPHTFAFSDDEDFDLNGLVALTPAQERAANAARNTSGDHHSFINSIRRRSGRRPLRADDEEEYEEAGGNHAIESEVFG